MKTYCAFLRGVNVNGTSMKMLDVCNVFVRFGMQNVTSVLATGNIIFSSDKNPQELKQILEKAMSDHFSYEAFLFIKSESEVKTIFENNPFIQNSEMHTYVFIGNETVGNTLLENFEDALKTENEKAKIADRIFYWKVSKGNTLDSSFGKILGKKSLKDQFTSRNINTLEKIIKKF